MNDQPMTKPVYDRTVEDLGNVVELGHVNVTVPDQRLATAFYVSGLGLTRDPYLMTSIDNMWINVGRAQFHLPLRPPQVVRGVTGLVLPDLESLMRRLHGAQKHLADTKFSFRETNDAVETTCPWGKPHPLPCPRCRTLQPDRAGHALCRVRRARRLVAGHREILPGNPGCPGRCRHGSRGRTCLGDYRRRQQAYISRERRKAPPPSTAITSRSLWWISQARTSACWSAV